MLEATVELPLPPNGRSMTEAPKDGRMILVSIDRRPAIVSYSGGCWTLDGVGIDPKRRFMRVTPDYFICDLSEVVGHFIGH